MSALEPLPFSPRSEIIMSELAISSVVGIQADVDGDGTWISVEFDPEFPPLRIHTHWAFLDVVTWVSEARKRPVLQGEGR